MNTVRKGPNSIKAVTKLEGQSIYCSVLLQTRWGTVISWQRSHLMLADFFSDALRFQLLQSFLRRNPLKASRLDCECHLSWGRFPPVMCWQETWKYSGPLSEMGLGAVDPPRNTAWATSTNSYLFTQKQGQNNSWNGMGTKDGAHKQRQDDHAQGAPPNNPVRRTLMCRIRAYFL